jgi:hypothetical protein
VSASDRTFADRLITHFRSAACTDRRVALQGDARKFLQIHLLHVVYNIMYRTHRRVTAMSATVRRSDGCRLHYGNLPQNVEFLSKLKRYTCYSYKYKYKRNVNKVRKSHDWLNMTKKYKSLLIIFHLLWYCDRVATHATRFPASLAAVYSARLVKCTRRAEA